MSTELPRFVYEKKRGKEEKYNTGKKSEIENR